MSATWRNPKNFAHEIDTIKDMLLNIWSHSFNMIGFIFSLRPHVESKWSISSSERMQGHGAWEEVSMKSLILRQLSDSISPVLMLIKSLWLKESNRVIICRGRKQKGQGFICRVGFCSLQSGSKWAKNSHYRTLNLYRDSTLWRAGSAQPPLQGQWHEVGPVALQSLNAWAPTNPQTPCFDDLVHRNKAVDAVMCFCWPDVLDSTHQKPPLTSPVKLPFAVLWP